MLELVYTTEWSRPRGHPSRYFFAVVYYVVFRFAITKFNLPTPGRESDEELAEILKAEAK
ncbi:hypothetical protein [Streptomyces sp. TE33382]